MILASAETKPEWINPLEYPFQSRYFYTPQGKLHYVDEGSGPCLVMLHGGSAWSFSYRHLIKGLSKKYRCLALDHMGFGLSDRPQGWSYKPKEHARNFADFIAATVPGPFTLVADDFGGPVGLSYALDHPRQVERLVLFNTWMCSLRGDSHFEGFSRMLGSRLGRFIYEQFNFSARWMVRRSMADKNRLTPEIYRHYMRPLASPQDRQASSVFARELLASSEWFASLWEKREKIQDIPALILWGMQDRMFREEELEKWEDLFSNATIYRLEHSGHFPHEEHGRDICPLIDRFLSATFEHVY